MADDPINLNRFRKRKAREQRERDAERNRAAHGATRADREHEAQERQRRETAMERHRRSAPAVPELRGERLVLRGWRDADLAPFAELNADSEVARHLPGTLTREQSDLLAARIRAHFALHGFGLWAVEVPGVVEFAGFVGLSVPAFEAPFTPCVEIGWRLAHSFWGRGYAPEGARLALDFGFRRAQLDEIVSFTVPANTASRRVMEKIGMRRDPADDFDHPNLPEGHPQRHHVLYRISRPTWLARGDLGKGR